MREPGSSGLPASSKDEAYEVTAVTAPPMELSILAVLNEVADAEIPLQELERAGYTVRADFARSRDEFSVRARAGFYDVILAIYPLRAWTALDLLAAMRELGIETPLILIAAGDDETAIELVNAGAADYVIRQNLQRLPMAVGRAIAEIRERQQRAGADDLIRKLTMAVNQSPASVMFTDTHGTIEYVNRRFSEVTGYAFAEAVGKTPRLVSSGRNPQEVYADMWETIRAGRIWRGELLNRKKSGELYWDSVSISPSVTRTEQLPTFWDARRM